MRLRRGAIRLLVLFAVAVIGLLGSPPASADAPFRVQEYVTDNAGVLSASDNHSVRAAIDKLVADRGLKLWVVYVKSFDGQGRQAWAEQTEKLSDFGTNDALLAIATEDRAYTFSADQSVVSAAQRGSIERQKIEPALRGDQWAAAATGAANGLGSYHSPSAEPSSGPHISAKAIWIAIAALVLLALLLWWWTLRRRRRRNKAELEAAKRVDPTDTQALAAVPLDALDGLSKQIVVDVDNAVRTSTNELELATEEFGATRVEPFAKAVANAKAALADAFNVRQILDDDVPETPLQKRQMLTKVITSAGAADRELETQQQAFGEMRSLLINAPERLDSMTQQMVALTARLEPAAATLAALHQQFAETAVSAVAGNVDQARQRLTFADENITKGRGLISAPAQDQTALFDTVRAAEGALQQSGTLLDSVDSAASDINRAISGMPAAIDDIQHGIDSAAAQLQQSGTPQADALQSAHDAAVKAVDDARANGSADPLGTFTRLTKADADLDQMLENVVALRAETQKQAQLLDQALFAAQSRVKAVSEFIDTRRGSIGPEARTRLSEAQRQLDAAQAKKDANPTEAIAHANGAASLAAQAQSLANDDVRHAQVSYAPQYSRQSDMGSVLGGIILGNVLRGGMGGGWGGGWGGGSGGGYGGSRSGGPTSFGGSGRSYGGGRF
jgi:uncharacterized membrane protein YgcG